MSKSLETFETWYGYGTANVRPRLQALRVAPQTQIPWFFDFVGFQRFTLLKDVKRKVDSRASKFFARGEADENRQHRLFDRGPS